MTTLPDVSVLTAWRKSSYSDNGENGCVEVSDGHAAQVPVRDSTFPYGPAVLFPATAWTAFVTTVKKETGTSGKRERASRR